MLFRDPNKLSDFPEAEKVTGDYGDVESLDRAFTGVSSAFIVSGYAEFRAANGFVHLGEHGWGCGEEAY